MTRRPITDAPAEARERIALPSDQDSSGRTLAEAELRLLAEVLRSGILTSTKGTLVKALESRFAELLGVKHVLACASGTAAVHTAVAALDPDPGDEIVTSPITDMGALTPILYQGAIPVFADVDPRTGNVTAGTIEPCLSERTRAIIATHLFGNPCGMDGIMRLAGDHDLPVIEDCAQAFLARWDDRLVGSIGRIGCFSLQQGKHITSGEGGLVATDDDDLARRMFLFINKGWGYGDDQPDHYFLALNYRMSELQGAVALAQLEKLQDMVEKRIASARLLTAQLKGVPGIEPPALQSRGHHTFWRYPLHVDDRMIKGGAVAMGDFLGQVGIASAPRYIQKPAFMCGVFQNRLTFGKSGYPFNLARPEAVDYSRSRFPGAYEALAGLLVLPWNERLTAGHVGYMAEAIREAVDRLSGGTG